jgi:succinate dehydrogenase / fumarate reductase cytochrome b subunit
MSSKKCASSTSIGKKQIMGVTGLLLCGFVLSHLLGNLTLVIGPDAFNKYSFALTSNPLIYGAEAILALLFLTHIFMAIRLLIENKRARGPQAYYMYKKSGRGGTFASSSMPYTGFITLVFLVFHICGLKFGTHYTTNVHGVEMRDIYRTTIEYFQNPINVIGYVITMVSLGYHTSHGFWSAFQSLGFNHPKYMPKIQCASKLFGIVIALGFSFLAIFCYVQGGH